MAHAQRLTQQVKDMSTRIKQLETALSHAQKGSLPISALGDDTVSQRLLQNSETNLEYEGDIDDVSKSLGSLAIDGEGKAQYYGETAGAEVLSLLVDLLTVSLMFCILNHSFCKTSCL
jgi:hypothetical protein